MYSYDSFGEPNRTSSVGNPYLFTGRRYDDETGLYYYRARYYHPEIGRFMQTDPIGYLGGINLYAYVKSNSVNLTDPYGLEPPLWVHDPTKEALDMREALKKAKIKCCKEYGQSIAEMLGMSVWECAWMVMGEAWSPKKLPYLVGGGLIGSKVPAVGIGLDLGGAAQYATALAFCAERECLEEGRMECGECK